MDIYRSYLYRSSIEVLSIQVLSNVIFNQCRESGDHGPINSWYRQLFWTDVRDGAKQPGWNPSYTEVAQNVIIANYGGSQGFDNDDGSSWYDIHDNVIYGEGLKQDRRSLLLRPILLLQPTALITYCSYDLLLSRPMQGPQAGLQLRPEAGL